MPFSEEDELSQNPDGGAAPLSPALVQQWLALRNAPPAAPPPMSMTPPTVAPEADAGLDKKGPEPTPERLPPELDPEAELAKVREPANQGTGVLSNMDLLRQATLPKPAQQFDINSITADAAPPEELAAAKKPAKRETAGAPAKEMPASTTAALQKLLDVGKSRLGSDEGLQNAQKSAADVKFVNELGKALDIAGSGINSGSHPTEAAQKLFDSNIKDADGIVADYTQRVANQKNDPGSPYSKAFKQYAKTLGFDIKGDFSAADGEKIMPMMFKGFEAEEARKNHREELDQKLKFHRDDMQYKYQMLKELQSQKNALKKDEDANKVMTDVGKQILTSKSRGVVKNAYEAERLVSNARGIIDEYRQNPNDANRTKLVLYFSELSKLAKGGVAGHSEFKEIMPTGAWSALANGISRVTGAPAGAHLGKFLMDTEPYLNTLEANARGVIGNNINEIIRTNERRLRPDDVSKLEELHGKYLSTVKKKDDASQDSIPAPVEGDKYAPEVESKILNAMNATGKSREQVLSALRSAKRLK